MVSVDGLLDAHEVAVRSRLQALRDKAAWVAAQLAAVLGLPVTAAKVEGLRSKLKRLVARDWILEPVPGSFAPVPTGSALPGVGS